MALGSPSFAQTPEITLSGDGGAARVVPAVNGEIELSRMPTGVIVRNGGLIDLGEPFIWFAGGLITLTSVIDRVVGALKVR